MRNSVKNCAPNFLKIVILNRPLYLIKAQLTTLVLPSLYCNTSFQEEGSSYHPCELENETHRFMSLLPQYS